MAYIRVKRGKFKVEINKKGYPRVSNLSPQFTSVFFVHITKHFLL
jgi:hypothetical protein